MEDNELYIRISEQLSQCESDFMSIAYSTTDWEPLGIVDCVIGSQKYALQGSQFVKGVGVVNGSCEEILSLIFNINSRKQWIPMLTEIQILKEFSLNFKIIHEYYKLPWPVSDRDFVFAMKSIERREGYLILLQDVDYGISEAENIIRGSIICGGYHLRRLDSENTQVLMMYSTDPKGLIPELVITELNKKAFTTINNIREALKLKKS